MLHERFVIVLPEHVDHKGITHLHQCFDRAVLGDGHAQAWRLEAGLTHPARHHRSAAPGVTFTLTGGDDVKATCDPTQGFVEVGIHVAQGFDGFLPGENLAEIGAGLFAALVVAALRQLTDSQGCES